MSTPSKMTKRIKDGPCLTFVGAAIRARMDERGCSKEQIASVMGVSLRRVDAALRGIPPLGGWTQQAIQDWNNAIDEAWLA